MEHRRERAGLNKSEKQELEDKQKSLKQHMQNAQAMQRQFQNDPKAHSMANNNYNWHKHQLDANQQRLNDIQQSNYTPKNR